jgi:hypothetical protein
MTSLFHIAKRDIILRFQYSKRVFILNILLLIFISLINSLPGQTDGLIWILIDRLFGGFSYESLEAYSLEGGFFLPYYWLLFQTLFILSLGTFFKDDFITQSEFVIIRTGKKRFVDSKVLSLFIYCIVYIISTLAIVLLITSLLYLFGFQDVYSSYSFKNESKVLYLYLFYLIMTLFIEALIFEIVSLKFNQIVGFILIILLLFFSMFNKNVLLFGSYTMLDRWIESNLLLDKSLIIMGWISFIIVILFLTIRILSHNVDLISKKGVEE